MAHSSVLLRRFAFIIALCALCAHAGALTPAVAQQQAVVTGVPDGHNMTVRAVRVPDGLELDGVLNEEIYSTVLPITDFVQMEPNPGAPSTEKTEVWIAYDDENVYVSVRCWDSTPESNWIVNEMRRDNINIVRNENLAWFFDTFHDKRNAFLFEVTPIEGIWDGQITNEWSTGGDWNPVWYRKAGRFEGGWTVETAVPFKSIRYRPGSGEPWGFNIRRTIRWKNEESFMTALPLVAGSSGVAAIFQVSNAATLVGLEAPSGAKNLEIKPYALSQITSDRLSQPATSNDLDGAVGFDVKYGITQNLTADFTYNTDFAQVEVDAQQVNLTRFSLFFPEKREFFLEGRGIFTFGGAGASGDTIPLLFFSRRIGLHQGRAIPIDAGARLTGKIGAFTLGAVSVQAADDETTRTPATNFSVLRVKRDILRRSTIGGMITRRSVSTVGPGSAETFGLDAVLGLNDYTTVNAYWARTSTPGLSGDDQSHRVQVAFNGDRYGFDVDRLSVGADFNPEVGFLRRDDFVRTQATARFSPRPESIEAVRKFTWEATYDYYENGAGVMETRNVEARFQTEFESTDTISFRVSRQFELLAHPFTVSRGVTIPAGAYSFQDAQLQLEFGNRRRLSGTVSLERGSFYSGKRTTVGYSSGRLLFTNRFSLEPVASINWVRLPEGRFTATILSNRATFTVTPLMFLSGLVQYNPSARLLGTNLRFRWEYKPGSELFVVYTDERNTAIRGSPELQSRAVVVKVNRLIRF